MGADASAAPGNALQADMSARFGFRQMGDPWVSLHIRELLSSGRDAHNDLVTNHSLHAGETDKPIAGLIKDL